VIFRTQRRVDVEPLSVADSLRERAMTSPRAWQAAVDDLEDEVVEIFFPPSYPSSPASSQNIFLRIICAVLVIFW
jgi:hypothetical protein